MVGIYQPCSAKGQGGAVNNQSSPVPQERVLWEALSTTARPLGSRRPTIHLPGPVTPQVVKWLSGIKKKDLSGCGKRTLTGDMSEISDITKVDLSGMNYLKGLWVCVTRVRDRLNSANR